MPQHNRQFEECLHLQVCSFRGTPIKQCYTNKGKGGIRESLLWTPSLDNASMVYLVGVVDNEAPQSHRYTGGDTCQDIGALRGLSCQTSGARESWRTRGAVTADEKHLNFSELSWIFSAVKRPLEFSAQGTSFKERTLWNSQKGYDSNRTHDVHAEHRLKRCR